MEQIVKFSKSPPYKKLWETLPKLWQFTKKQANNNCFMFHSNCIFLLVK